MTFQVAPRDLRDLAAKVIQQCVTIRGGIGGFGTLGIANVLSYAAQGNTPYNQISFPLSTAFITVGVVKMGKPVMNPGDTDPAIARLLSREAPTASMLGVSGLSDRYNPPSTVWLAQAGKMNRGSTWRWYDTTSRLSYEMAYQCDSKLGAPSIVDCAQIEWDQLSPSSDTLAVSPGVTTFLHSNACYLAISAAISLVLTWAQIRTATSTLMNMCLHLSRVHKEEEHFMQHHNR